MLLVIKPGYYVKIARKALKALAFLLEYFIYIMKEDRLLNVQLNPLIL